ncbi:MAG: ATP-binding protein [Marinilabiliaceae bacterium]|nr:ATP-binding protein [Marinilabiliaceae bacterium]
MIKIAITGPESVGKSTLSQQLAKHFHGNFVTEFARDYIQQLNRSYNYFDVEKIAKKQIEQYINVQKQLSYPYVFFDTFLIITKVWFEFVWQKYPDWLDKSIEDYPMDLYLLCAPDIPWEADGVRENGTIRESLFIRYKELLKFHGCNYKIVYGSGDVRVVNAISLVERI